MTDASTSEYKVDLDNFAGPMDLLLYLIRKEEVEIYEIPISSILEQYMQYLEMIQAVDLDEAGEFLVMASTLMVIKSKMLLPVEEVDLAEELDPRYELVQQLSRIQEPEGRVLVRLAERVPTSLSDVAGARTLHAPKLGLKRTEASMTCRFGTSFATTSKRSCRRPRSAPARTRFSRASSFRSVISPRASSGACARASSSFRSCFQQKGRNRR